MAPTVKYSVRPLLRASWSGLLVLLWIQPINIESFCFQHLNYPTKELLCANIICFHFISHSLDGRIFLNVFCVRNGEKNSFQRSEYDSCQYQLIRLFHSLHQHIPHPWFTATKIVCPNNQYQWTVYGKSDHDKICDHWCAEQAVNLRM